MKRLFSVAITLTAALGLAACGGTSGTDTTTPDAAPATPTGLVLTGAEQTSLSFSWNASAGADMPSSRRTPLRRRSSCAAVGTPRTRAT